VDTVRFASEVQEASPGTAESSNNTAEPTYGLVALMREQHVTAQQGARVGILSPEGSASTKVFDAFCAGLRDLDYWQRPHAPIVLSKGPLSKPTTATVSWPRERLFVPHSGRSRSSSRRL
jgi:hypothetical protein